MNSSYYDIKIYHSYDQDNRYSPRRINENGYHIEWQRAGILFLQCPDGKIHREDSGVEDIHVHSDMLIEWKKMMKPTDTTIKKFQIIDSNGTVHYVFRVIQRTFEEWLNWCNEVPGNYNLEVMFQIAEPYESKWNDETTFGEIIEICTKFGNDLPLGIDDIVRDLILETWQQRLEQRVIKGLLSDDVNAVSESVPHFKKLIFRN